MKCLSRLIVACMLVCLLAVSVSAAGMTKMESHSTVSSNGECQVSITATLHLDEAADKLTFPIPAGATGVTLNGSRVSASKDGDVRNINLRRLTGGMPGDFSIHIAYTLDDVIYTTEEGLLQMQVPLLSGCAYPVEEMSFSVTLPGGVDALPSFVSGYHQASIEQSLAFQTDGAMVSGNTLKALKDHETLTLTMMVSEEMFPQSIVKSQDYTFGAVAMGICGGLAVLYWLLFMANLPTRRHHETQPPQGTNAGSLGCVLGLEGVDLPMMIFTWAQLGYVLIQIDRRQKVVLHKRMDMGNERSDAERRWFVKLFGKKNVVDTAGYTFALLWQKAVKSPMGVQEFVSRHAGSKTVFRVLASGIGLFGGASLGMVMGSGAFLKWLLIIALAAAGGIAGWSVQAYMSGIVLRHRKKLWQSLTLCGIWLVLGLICDAFMLAFWTVVGLLAAGFLLFWGGRRTALGRTTRGQVLDLKRYLRKISKEEAAQLSQEDPDYFFRLAPEALALGVDREFARKFGSLRYPGCPYLTNGMDAHMTALQWNAMMRRALEAMDDRGQSLTSERLLGLLRSLIRG